MPDENVLGERDDAVVVRADTYLVHNANIAPPETTILITGIPRFS